MPDSNDKPSKSNSPSHSKKSLEEITQKEVQQSDVNDAKNPVPGPSGLQEKTNEQRSMSSAKENDAEKAVTRPLGLQKKNNEQRSMSSAKESRQLQLSESDITDEWSSMSIPYSRSVTTPSTFSHDVHEQRIGTEITENSEIVIPPPSDYKNTSSSLRSTPPPDGQQLGDDRLAHIMHIPGLPRSEVAREINQDQQLADADDPPEHELNNENSSGNDAHVIGVGQQRNNDAPQLPQGSPANENREDNPRNNADGTEDRNQENNDQNDPERTDGNAQPQSQTNCMENARNRIINGCERCSLCSKFICNCIEQFRAPTYSPKKNIDWKKLVTGRPRGYWVLIAVIIAWIWFFLWNNSLVEAPVIENFNVLVCSNDSTSDRDEVPCLSQNETDFLTHERVSIFVNVLHSIILNEGCTTGLEDKFNIAAHFRDRYPVIEDYIILNDLIRIHKLELKNATKLIRICRIFFSGSSLDLVRPDGHTGFLYIYDDLMKYCSYTGNWRENVWISVSTFFLVHSIIIFLRVLARKSRGLFKLCKIEECCQCGDYRPVHREVR